MDYFTLTEVLFLDRLKFMGVFLFLGVFFWLSSSPAEVLFEAYYKVVSQNETVGGAVRKYEQTEKGLFLKSYLHMSLGSLKLKATLKAHSDKKFGALSYVYNGQLGSRRVQTKASFHKLKKGWKMEALLTENGKVRKIQKNFSQPVLLSSFLYLLLSEKLKNPLPPVFHYQALAEESGELIKGFIKLEKKEKKNSMDTFWFHHRFGSKLSFLQITPRGEVLQALSSQHGLKFQLLPSIEKKPKILPLKDLKEFFGALPKGHIHSLSLSSGV